MLWVIVDSGSNDNTFKLSNQMFKNYEWIKIIKQKKFFEEGYGHLNFSEAINDGYKVLKEIAKQNDIHYNFVGKTDATPILCEKYFEILISKMNEDSELAITCGIQKILYKDSEIKIEPYMTIPMTGFNDIRLYRKDFFEEVNGYPLTPSPDSVLLIKAKNRKWKVDIIKEAYFSKSRLGGSKIGIWNGWKLKGKSMYILGYHPLLALLNGLAMSKKLPPHYQFFPLIWGYLLSFLKRDNRISDEEVREYYGKKRLKEVLTSLKVR